MPGGFRAFLASIVITGLLVGSAGCGSELSTGSSAVAGDEDLPPVVEDELILIAAAGADPQDIEDLVAAHGAVVRSTVPEDNLYLLGVDPDEKFEVQRIAPADYDDALLFFTDGMNEAAGEDSDLLGLSPVIEAISALPQRTTSAMIRTARSEVRSHLQGAANSDDMTFLALHLSS